MKAGAVGWIVNKMRKREAAGAEAFARKKGSGRQRTVRTPAAVGEVKDALKKNPRITLRRLESESQINRSSVRHICREVAGLKSLRMVKSSVLTRAAKLKRVEIAPQIMKRINSGEVQVDDMMFTDEKNFTMGGR